RKGLLAVEDVGGVRVHRVPEPGWPRDLDRFVAWVEQMNEDMLDAGKALAEEEDFDLIHGHDWLVARAAAALADRLGVPYVTTVHATEHGRHQGWVQDHPQSHIHAVERWMANRADAVIVCSYYMRGHVADIFDIAERRITVIPNGIDPGEMRAVGDLQALRLEFARPDEKLVLFVGRLVYEKGFQLALDALPGVIEQVAGVRFGLRFNGGDAAHLGVMIERLLVDSPLRERLVAEASEHVLRFDWDDIAARTRGTYGELTEREGAGRRAGELAARHGGGSRG